MDRVIEDLQWFYKTLDIGGKTAEFYEAQKSIILQGLVALEKQIPKEPLDFGDESYLCSCCKRNNFYKGMYLDKQNYCNYCGQAIKWE